MDDHGENDGKVDKGDKYERGDNADNGDKTEGKFVGGRDFVKTIAHCRGLAVGVGTPNRVASADECLSRSLIEVLAASDS